MNTEWLDPLLRRHLGRFRRQRHEPDHLPAANIDLTPLTQQIVKPRDGEKANRMRDLDEQVAYLSRVFEGKSELQLLHAVTISYLRRRTAHNGRAAQLFFRIWEEHSDFMVEQLTPRWLVSALQTFYDHGRDGGERTAGATGFMYGNLIKIYEGEHKAIRPRVDADALEFKAELNTVKGLYSFTPGDDVLANINVLALDVAMNGGAAGPPLLRLMEHIHNGKTIFRRIDDLLEKEKYRNRRHYTLSWGTTVPLSNAKQQASSNDGQEA